MTPQTIIKICLTGLLALVVLYVVSHWHKWDETVVINAEGEPVTQSAKIVYKLISCIVLAVIGGIYFVMVVLPKFGDAVGTVMYSSGESVTADESMRAAAKMAAGDYEGAISEYEKVLKEKPDDPFPVSEIGKIYAEKLEDPARAIAFMQEHLESKEWNEENAAFLMFRIADVHTHQRHDYDSAKDILEQVAGNFPGTRHSANARHRINELEQAQFKELQTRRSQQSQGGASV